MKYIPQHAPWEHQSEALRLMKGRKAFALLMAMRTGKTATILADFGQLELDKATNDLLVIAPAGVYRTWEVAIQEHLSKDLLKRSWVYTWSAGRNSQTAKREEAQFIEKYEGARILLVNVEALSSVDRAKKICLDFVQRRKCYTAVDESTTIKNIDSQRTTFVVDKLGPLAAVKRILSGLPSPRSPLDLYCQFQFLDKDILDFENYAAFQRRYATIERIVKLPTDELARRLSVRTGSNRMKVQGLGTMNITDMPRNIILQELEQRKVYIRESFPKLIGYKNEHELREKIAPHSYRVRLEDCYDMPPKVYMRREVEMTAQQKRIYKELKEISTAEIEDLKFVTAHEVITRMLRLHQVLCGHTKDEEGNDHLFEELRTKEVINIIEEFDGKAIIWCSYDIDVNKVTAALEKEYGEGSTARFWGGNRNTRESEEKRFLNSPECRFMVATPAAGGRGRTWTVASLIVYYSNTNNLEHRSQSEERASGNKKNDYVTCVDILVPGTMDEIILKALREKINLSDVITGDNWREWVV